MGRSWRRLLAAAVCALWLAASYGEERPRVVLETSLGHMEVELYADESPATVENFLHYVTSGLYDGTIFHRTVYGWIIQGGGYDEDLYPIERVDPIVNEADNGLSNVRGTLAMAREWDPDTADSQFFINLRDNPGLDHTGTSKRRFGYCVFGRVINGMEVADAIGSVETHEVADFDANVPVDPVFLQRAYLVVPQSP